MTGTNFSLLSFFVGQGLALAEIILSQYGKIAKEQLLDLENTAGASPCPTISDVICSFKSLTTRICLLRSGCFLCDKKELFYIEKVSKLQILKNAKKFI